MAAGVRSWKRGGVAGRDGRVRAVLLLAALLIGALALFAWQQSRARDEAERAIGLEATRVLSENFSRAAALKVGTLSGDVQARATDPGFAGLLRSEQTVRLPYSVDYFVELSRLAPGAFTWNPDARAITVSVPDVRPARPNIDEARATIDQSGLFISRRAAQALARTTSQRAAVRARETAAKPEHLDRAREQARVEIAELATGFLGAAGLDDVRVAVRFPWEPAATTDGERWDESRRIEDVLKERAGSQTKTS